VKLSGGKRKRGSEVEKGGWEEDLGGEQGGCGCGGGGEGKVDAAVEVGWVIVAGGDGVGEVRGRGVDGEVDWRLYCRWELECILRSGRKWGCEGLCTLVMGFFRRPAQRFRV